MTDRPPTRSGWLTQRLSGDRAILRAEQAVEPPTMYYAGGAEAGGEPGARGPNLSLGAVPEVVGQARQRRLALPPAVREKLERLEAQAAAARAEVLRVG